MSNSLDPDPARQNFGPDLNTNCLLLKVISRRMWSGCKKFGFRSGPTICF